jgi:hypothetical protein
MQRPTGITILAVLYFIGAVFLLLGAFAFFAGGSFLAQVLASMPGMSTLAGGLVTVVGVVLLAFAALYGATGYGLISLKSWGRILAIIFTVLGLVGTLVGFISIVSNFGMGVAIWQVVKLGICVWILWYLFQPNVKQAFGQTS